jgi:hypothetical protein
MYVCMHVCDVSCYIIARVCGHPPVKNGIYPIFTQIHLICFHSSGGSRSLVPTAVVAHEYAQRALLTAASRPYQGICGHLQDACSCHIESIHVGQGENNKLVNI